MSGSSSPASRKARMASAANVMYTNAVYWPNQSIYSGNTPGDLNYGCISRVYYAYANVSTDGSVFVSSFLMTQSGLPVLLCWPSYLGYSILS